MKRRAATPPSKGGESARITRIPLLLKEGWLRDVSSAQTGWWGFEDFQFQTLLGNSLLPGDR